MNNNKLKNRNECSGCHACSSICPVNAIVFSEDNEGFLFPNINKSICINCGKCSDVCNNTNSYIINEQNRKIKSYAAFSKNNSIRLSSSSGGLFSVIAKFTLEHNGIVFGYIYTKFC